MAVCVAETVVEERKMEETVKEKTDGAGLDKVLVWRFPKQQFCAAPICSLPFSCHIDFMIQVQSKELQWDQARVYGVSRNTWLPGPWTEQNKHINSIDEKPMTAAISTVRGKASSKPLGIVLSLALLADWNSPSC
jgi:hypothetical protein